MIKIHTWQKYVLYDSQYDTPAFQNILKHIDAYIAKPLRVLKNDNSSTVVVIEVDGQYLVIKRANTKSWMHGFRRCFAKSRARKNWLNTKRLQQANIATFKAIAMYEKRWGPLQLGSYFICSYIEAFDALYYFSNPKLSSQWPAIATNMIKMIHTLEKNQICHRDLNLSNILILEQQTLLIDLESMRKHGFKILAYFFAKRERARLIKNWRETASALPETLTLFEKLLN